MTDAPSNELSNGMTRPEYRRACEKLIAGSLKAAKVDYDSSVPPTLALLEWSLENGVVRPSPDAQMQSSDLLESLMGLAWKNPEKAVDFVLLTADGDPALSPESREESPEAASLAIELWEGAIARLRAGESDGTRAETEAAPTEDE